MLKSWGSSHWGPLYPASHLSRTHDKTVWCHMLHTLGLCNSFVFVSWFKLWHFILLPPHLMLLWWNPLTLTHFYVFIWNIYSRGSYKPAGGHVVLVDLTFPVNAEAGEAVGTRDGHSRVETFSVIHNPGVWKEETRNQRHKVRTIKGFLLLIYILLHIDL